MDEDMLSQDEIDALLSISENEEQNDSSAEGEIPVSDYLSPIEEDTIGEIGNISFGSSATTLSTILNEQVSITTPEVSIIKKESLYDKFSPNDVKVKVKYVEGFHGENLFVIKAKDAAVIADIMIGGDGTNPAEEIDEMHLSAIQEAMNQMMGSAATSMSTVFDKRINISPPNIAIDEKYKKAVNEIEEEVFVQVLFQLRVGNLVDSNIMQLIPFPFAHEMVEELIEKTSEKQEEVQVSNEPEMAQMHQQDEEPSFDEAETETRESQFIGESVDASQSVVQQASFSEFEEPELTEQKQRNLDLLLDIPLNVTVELGRTKRPVKNILDLSSGSIIELDKLAGEPVDILVNQKLIAKGEVVVIDENFGVRVTDIISKSARLQKLK